MVLGDWGPNPVFWGPNRRGPDRFFAETEWRSWHRSPGAQITALPQAGWRSGSRPRGPNRQVGPRTIAKIPHFYIYLSKWGHHWNIGTHRL